MERSWWKNTLNWSNNKWGLDKLRKVMMYKTWFAGFKILRTVFVGSSWELQELLKFWTGWSVPPQHLYVEVSPDKARPEASTCMTTLKLPLKRQSYKNFKESLEASVQSTKFGFGMIWFKKNQSFLYWMSVSSDFNVILFLNSFACRIYIFLTVIWENGFQLLDSHVRPLSLEYNTFKFFFFFYWSRHVWCLHYSAIF